MSRPPPASCVSAAGSTAKREQDLQPVATLMSADYSYTVSELMGLKVARILPVPRWQHGAGHVPGTRDEREVW